MSAEGKAVLPSRIAHYRILGLLGEGSSGCVYLAEETAPLRRVALKVLRSVGLPAEAQRRFRREVELLGALEHPGIARLYAAGTADGDSGPVPYLAMELVEGDDLLCHANTHALDLRARLQLLAQVARSVHFAHTQGVIHRDLKPGNILVDASGQPKVLDFGIAHAARADLTQMTVAGQVLGTLPYMAPEQIAGRTQSDARIDVYALGVVGYELIAGQLPFPGLSSASVIEALATIQRGTPPRLSRLAPAAAGDVETMLGKAMARDPAQRYASLAEFAADLERWLLNRPIEARPPTAGYLLRLFVRRHRVASAAAALVLLAILVGAVVSARYAVSESQARREAEQRSAELDAVNRFLRDMLTAAAPEKARGRTVSVLDAIDAARIALDADRALPPGVTVQLRTTLGDTLTSLGQATPAITQLEAAIATAEAHPEQAGAARGLRISLAAAYQLAGRYADAELQLQQALDGLQTTTLADERLRVQGVGRQAELLLARDRQAEAIALLAPLQAEAAARLGTDDPDALETLRRLAVARWQSGDYGGADRLQRQLLDQRATRLGRDHPQSLDALEGVALIQREWGRYPQAEVLWREALAARRRVMGAEHLTTLLTEQGLAATLWAAGRSAEPETEQLARHSLEGLRAQLGEQDFNTRTGYMVLAIMLRDRQQPADAEPLIRKVLQGLDQRRPAAIDITGLNHYGQLLMQMHRPADALATYDRLLQRLPEVLGPEHPSNAIYHCNRADALLKLGRVGEARDELIPALAQLKANLAPEHPRIKTCTERLAAAQQALGLAAAD